MQNSIKNISRKILFLKLDDAGYQRDKTERAKLLSKFTGHPTEHILKKWFAKNNTRILLTENELSSLCKHLDCDPDSLTDPTDYYSYTFGDALDALMHAKKPKMTHPKLAEKLHIKTVTVDKWTQGKTTPDFRTLCALCDIFECDLDYFTGRLDDTHDIKTHKVKFISDETGLSPKAINALIKFKKDSEGTVPKKYIDNPNFSGRVQLEQMNIDCINMILEHEEGSYNNSILVMIYQYVKSIDPDFCYYDFDYIYDDRGEAVRAEEHVTNLDHSITVSSPSMPFGYNIQLKEMYPTVFKDMLLRKIEEYRDQ